MAAFENSDGANVIPKTVQTAGFDAADYQQGVTNRIPKENGLNLSDLSITTANGGPAYCTDLNDPGNCPFLLPDSPQSPTPAEQGPRETRPKFIEKERPGHDSGPGNPPVIVPPVIQQEMPKIIGRPRREPTSTNPFHINEIRV